MAGMPASWRSHLVSKPAAPRMRSTASVTSGPMPSPGISVIVRPSASFSAPESGSATVSRSIRSSEVNAAGVSDWTSIAPTTRSPARIGTTISDRVSGIQAR